MKYRLVAIDMDGTLLDERKCITGRTLAAVKRAGERGVFVCLSTGRPLCGVDSYMEQLQLSTPTITCNGAVVIDPDSGRIIHSQFLQPQAAREIWQRGTEYGTTMCVWVGDKLYVNRFDERTEDYKKLSGVQPEIVDTFESLANKGISKILWYDNIERIRLYKAELKDRMNQPVRYVTSDPRFLEFTDENVSKASALKCLGEHLGIPREQIMAIGDGENDLPMLEYAGLSVAMGNASEYIRSRCDYVTDTNVNDGAAKAIERFCLMENKDLI